MADITVTPASVVKGTGATINKDKVAGEAVTAGQSVYLKASDDKWWLAQADGTSAEAAAGGIALHAAAANQPVAVQTGGQITIGGTTAAGLVYVVSTTFGGIAPSADLNTGHYLTILGYGISNTVIEMLVRATGIAKA